MKEIYLSTATKWLHNNQRQLGLDEYHYKIMSTCFHTINKLWSPHTKTYRYWDDFKMCNSEFSFHRNTASRKINELIKQGFLIQVKRGKGKGRKKRGKKASPSIYRLGERTINGLKNVEVKAPVECVDSKIEQAFPQ